MVLSTSELVTDIFSEPAAEGQSGATPITAGTESWLLGVQLAGSPGTVCRTFFLIQDEHRSHSWTRLLKNIVADPYLFDEGSVVLSSAFLFDNLSGAGAALLRDAFGVAWRAERLPF